MSQAQTNVEFEKIQGSMRNPGVYSEYNAKGAVTALPVNPQNVLMVAPQSAEMDTPFSKPVVIFSDVEAKNIFGAGSLAHLMVRQALLNNPNMRLTVIGLKDHSAGIAAEGGIDFNGVAESSGVVNVNLAGTHYALSVAKGEADSAITTRLIAILNSASDCPVVARVNETNPKSITLTAKAKGEIGNEIHLEVKSSAKGLTLSLTAFSGGQQNAEIAGALASVAGEHFNIIVSPFSDNLNAQALRAHLESVSEPTAKKPAIGVMGWRKTLSTGTTLTRALNSERLTVAWYKGAIEPNGLLAAGYAAVIASEEDPARPLNTLEVKGLSLVDSAQFPTFAEFSLALYNGLTPLEVVNHRVQIMRAITTYTKSPTNTDDPSYLDLTTIRTLDFVRKAIEQRIALRFPRAKLAKKKTPQAVRSEILDVLYRLENAEIIECVDEHKARLIVTVNRDDVNRIDTVIPADVVNGLHVVANRIDLIL